MSRSEIGVVRKHVSSTRITQRPGGNQSFNLFAEPQTEESIPQLKLPVDNIKGGTVPAIRSSTVRLAPPGGRSSVANLFSSMDENMNNNASTTSVRVATAPGGSSSGMASVLAPETTSMPPPAVPARRPSAAQPSNIFATNDQTDSSSKSSVRLHAAPGGVDQMADILTGKAEQAPVTRKPNVANLKSNIFNSLPAPIKPSTRVVTVPGGNSNMSAIISNTAAPEELRTFKTGRTNQGNNIFDATPVVEQVHSARTAQKNVSQNVINLPSDAVRDGPPSARTYRANMPSVPSEPAPLPADRFQGSIKMMSSSVFTADGETGPVRPSTRVHHAPGGKSSNIFAQ